MTRRGLIIAVDGPAAAGKGTLAKALAEKLGLPYLDTGLLYRAVARRMLEAGLDPASDAAATARALRPEDVARSDLRLPEIDRAASQVAAQPDVRAALLERQRDFARQKGGVIDGRDIGTTVFPDADVKFFVTASPEIRAARRYVQRNGAPCPDRALLEAEIEALLARDRQDATRAVAPLCAAPDAVRLETDRLSAESVLEAAYQVVKTRFPAI